MRSAARITRIAGLTVVLITVALAVAGFQFVRQNVEALDRSARENILWSAVQMEFEFHRFEKELAEFRAGGLTDARHVNTRFDILWSRVNVVRHGNVGERVQSYDRNDGTLNRFWEALSEVEPLVVSLRDGEAHKAARIAEAMKPFRAKLRRLTINVLHGESAIEADLRRELFQSARVLLYLSALAVVASMVMLVIFMRESNRFRMLARQNRDLLEEATRANQIKSQFLTMMSHELRTPMNGVLGNLTLLRQTNLSERQAELVTQANRSGGRMGQLLDDLMEFSEMGDAGGGAADRPFRLDWLIAELEASWRIHGHDPAALSQSVDAGTPRRWRGDMQRLHRALSQLTGYFGDRSGLERIHLDYRKTDSGLQVAMRAGFATGSGDWQPEILAGDIHRSGSFASDDLGAAIGRGIVDQLGGKVEVETGTDGEPVVYVLVPFRPFDPQTLEVLVHTPSQATAAICKAALGPLNVRLTTCETAQNPDIVIWEGPAEDEDGTAVLARYARAYWVGIGSAPIAEICNQRLSVPLDLTAIRATVSELVAP